ncbi:hypothetical protein EG801_23355 [Escherichia coli]|nr:hypothetical protein [Escherichia coli]
MNTSIAYQKYCRTFYFTIVLNVNNANNFIILVDIYNILKAFRFLSCSAGGGRHDNELSKEAE